MSYTPENGDVADSAWRAQAVSAFAGDYIIDGCQTALGDSTTSIETIVDNGVINSGGDPVVVDQQTVTHPDGPTPGSGPDGGDPARVDLVTIDSNGDAGRMTGTPAVPDPPDREFPNALKPVPPTPTPSDDVVASAALVVPNGTGSSSEMFNDAVVPREVMGDGLNDLQLIPGRDLQYELDNAREGQVLKGDRSQTITIDQPLTVSTPDITIRDLSLRYAGNAAQSASDHMLTLAADGITVEDVTIDGNKSGQSYEHEGINIRASECRVADVVARNINSRAVVANGVPGRIEETAVDRLRAESCRGDALAVQGEAVRTRADTIKGINSVDQGTVTVRNGAINTKLENIYGESQAWIINLADGNEGSDNSPFQTLTIDGVRGGGVTRIIQNETTDIGHAGLVANDVKSGNVSAAQAGGGYIDFSNISNATLTNAYINHDTAGAWGVYANPANGVTVEDSLLRTTDPDRGGIHLVDGTGIRVRNCTTGRFGETTETVKAGILVLADTTDTSRIVMTDNAIDNETEQGIALNENNGTISSAIVKNNVAPTLTNNATGANVVVKDNIPL